MSSMAERIRMDWARIIRELGTAGLSINDIAGLLDRAPSTVHDWTRGAEPKHSDGEALLKLYSENRIGTSAI